MKVEQMQKYIGKRVLLVLRNNFSYTTVIPYFEGEGLTIVDKFGEEVEIDVNFIEFIKLEKEKR